ncbi:MAG TPA: hypothetical protein VLA19_25995 [Herpetosiphonaceae bacterium]|nr:hypothetical protein [Herpetosiphonaceae bacterium]
MKIQISPSENYDPYDVRALLDELSEEGMEMTQAGFYGRRSMDYLPPALIMTAGFAASLFAGGFLNAAGADAWAALKRVVARAVASRHEDQHPAVMLYLEFTDGTVRLELIHLVPEARLSEQLDKALDRARELKRATTLMYDEESESWLTIDEVLLKDVRRAKKVEAPTS